MTMKSTILISRITRVVETEGAVGEGVSLAEEYSEAVRKVNARLEAVQTAIDAKQVSDAVRMMEDAPRLLDEVGALDFNRLPDWEVLCGRNHWTPPAKLDKALLERVLMLNESTEVVEPFLRMYRKAVRTNNNKLAVQSLRRLAQIDHSQNWNVNLVQAEEAVQKQILADFRSAKSSGNKDEVERLSQEFAETDWSEPPSFKGLDEIRSYIAEEAAKRRCVEGAEDLTILHRCIDENWNRQLAFSMLQAVDALVEKGWCIPAEDLGTVEMCRKRCAEEMEAESKEARWKELCEDLHAAIQQENTAAIRDVLSAPEFLDREPDPELIKQAQLVIQHEETARKRKMMQIAFCAMAGLLAVLGVSGWWLKQKLFNDRCEGEAIKLTALQKGAHAVDRLSEALQRLQSDAPEVYADPRVNVFDGKLKTMRSQMIARTNEISMIIADLKTLQSENWGDGVDSVTSRFSRIETLLTKDDDGYKSELLKVKTAWADHCEATETANKNAASKFHEMLISHVNGIASRLKSELMSPELEKEIASCKSSIDEWRRIHAQNAPALESAVNEAERSLNEAENTQKNLEAAIQKMKSASSAEDYLKARKDLFDYYSAYPFVKAIGAHPITVDDARDLVAKATAEQTAYAEMLSSGVDDATFRSFITDNVVSLAEIPSYYSLYGIWMKGARSEWYFAICKGKPQIKKPSYDSSYQIDGELLDFGKGEMVQQMTRKAISGRPAFASLATSDEIKSVVDIAGQANLSQARFESEILKLISGHLKVAGEKDFVKNEVDVYGKQFEFAVGRFPAIRRVQLLQLYFTWLKEDLKLLPQDGAIARWYDKVESLSQPVRVDNVPEDLTWACMRESRVRQRNSECAKLLSQMASQRFIEEVRAWKSARMELRKISDWRIEYAGNVSFNPHNRNWMKDHSAVIPDIANGVAKDHPLYLLRRVNGKLVLKKALVPVKNNTSWGIHAGMSKEFVTGDPLFQVSENGKYIDAEDYIKKILSGVPENTAKQFLSKIPLFNVEAK